MTNPFDDPDGSFVVLLNTNRQYSLWPSGFAAPHGWQLVHGPAICKDCNEYIDREWVELKREQE